MEVERALGERDQVARAEHGEVVERERLQRDRRVRRGHHRAQQQEHGEVVGPTHHTLVLRTRERRTENRERERAIKRGVRQSEHW